MSLSLAKTVLTTPIENARWPSLRRAIVSVLSPARRPRLTWMIPALTEPGRLSVCILRDVGLREDQVRQAPIWGHGGIMWRP